MKVIINFNSEIKNKNYLFENNKKDLYRILKFVVKKLKIKKIFSISLNLLTSEQIKYYNYKYRGFDKITDVLSFENKEATEDEYDLGDILINGSILKEQAKSIDSDENMELKFLFMHGLLHIAGYDHYNDEDEKKMIAKQKEIFKKLKIREE